MEIALSFAAIYFALGLFACGMFRAVNGELNAKQALICILLWPALLA